MKISHAGVRLSLRSPNLSQRGLWVIRSALWFALCVMASTSITADVEARDLIRCSGQARDVRWTWKIDTNGKAGIEFVTAQGQRHSCPLFLLNISDYRRGVAPEVVFDVERVRACTPRLPETLRQTLAVSHQLRTSTRDDRRGQARAVIFRADAESECRHQPMRAVDLEMLIRKIRTRGPMVPAGVPEEAPDDIRKAAEQGRAMSEGVSR